MPVRQGDRAISGHGVTVICNLMEVWMRSVSSGEKHSGLEKGLTKDFRVHHHLPGIDWQVSIVEAPVELLLRFRLIGSVVIWRDVFVCESFGGRYPFPGIKDEHFVQKVERYNKDVRFRAKNNKRRRERWLTHFISRLELLRERHSLPLRETLDESQSILRSDCSNNVVRWGTEQFSDDGELVDIYRTHKFSLGRFNKVKHPRSLPGNKGFPSSISAKIQPVLQMSTIMNK